MSADFSMDGHVRGEDGRRRYDLTTAAADYQSWPGPPRRSLVICTQQRCGSTLLGEAIYFAKGLGCPLEYFHPGFILDRWHAPNIVEYAKTLHRLRTDPSGVFSIKVFWRDLVALVRELEPTEHSRFKGPNPRQTTESDYRRIFATVAWLMPAPTFVFLKRRDEIRQAISMSVAGQTRIWRRFSTLDMLNETQPPKYDFDDIVWLLAQIQSSNAHWGNFFRANNLGFYEVYYEDLASDYEGTLRKFFAGIGRPDAPIGPPRMHRQSDDRSEESVRRFMADFRTRARG
jgi:LPS sulfotransferase NodH